MKFFIDTADIKAIREAMDMGLVDGVTTNPSLVAKTGRKFREVVDEICQLVDGPISLEAVATEAGAIYEEAKELAAIHPNVVVKVPLVVEGLKAVRRLSEEGIKTNVTLCFSPAQALLAAKAGATYISPFVGRLDDISHVGMELIAQILEIYDNYGFKTEIIVASIRNPLHLLDTALAGAHISTIPPKVLLQLAKHPLTDIGVEKFLADHQKTLDLE